MLNDITIPMIFSYFLVLCRTGAGIMMMPGISEGDMSPRGRLVLALGLAVVLTPAVQPSLPKMPGSAIEMGLLMAGEIMIGLMIGSVARIIVSAMHVAGTTISFQNGLSAAVFFDPTQGGQSSSIGIFLTTLALLLIFVTGLDHIFIRGLTDSYVLFTPGLSLPVDSFADMIIKTVAGSFEVGIKIAAPHLVIGLMLYLGAGIMSRLMPQMQIFFIMMPVQIALGFFILMVTLTAGVMWFLDYYSEVMMGFLAQ